jgi:hypothetical protein
MVWICSFPSLAELLLPLLLLTLLRELLVLSRMVYLMLMLEPKLKI